MTKKLTYVLCCMLALVSSQAMSQTDTAADAEKEDNRYIIEMTVFTNEEAYNAQEEVWPNTLELAYPDGNYAVIESEDYSPLASNQAGPLVLRKAPQSTYRHQNIIEKLNKSHKHKVLFHQAWIQPLTDRDNAPFVAIEGGQKIDGVSQLAGSLKIYRARYLHVRANLWFVSFAPGVEELHWFENTTVPDETPESSDLTITETAPSVINTIDEASLFDPSKPLGPAAQTQATMDEEQTDELIGWTKPPQPPFEKNETEEEGLQSSDELQDEELVFPESEKRTEDIIRIGKLTEARRMRSNEIHYLDHPLFAVIIEIRPLSEE